MKWDTVERSLTNVVSRRQTVSHFEQDMQNWVHEREKLGRKLEVLQAKLKSASDKQEQVVSEQPTGEDKNAYLLQIEII